MQFRTLVEVSWSEKLSVRQVKLARRRVSACLGAVWILAILTTHQRSVHALQSIRTIPPTQIAVPRGGADKDETLNDNGKETPSSETEEATTASSQPIKLWSPGALFQLNDQIIAEITQEDEESEIEGETTANNNPDAARGGALVKTAPRRFQWFTPLDTKRVAPLSSRLMMDETETTRKETETSKSKDQGERPSATTSAWWVDARMSQLPDQQDDEPSRSDARNQTDNLFKEEEEKLAEIFSSSDMINETVAEVFADEPDLTKEQVVPKKEKRPKKKKSKKETIDTESEIAGVVSLPTPEMPLQDTLSTSVSPTLQEASPYESSGYWTSIDRILTFGYAGTHPGWKLSVRLRRARKLAAKYTGLHGVLSGKPVTPTAAPAKAEELGMIRRRLAAIDRARRKIPLESPRPRRFFRPSRDNLDQHPYFFAPERSAREEKEEQRRKERVKEIDRLFAEGQQRLAELACEKDMLQRRPNPLWNYTTAPMEEDQLNATNVTSSLITASRVFTFPPKDLVEEYLDMLFLSNRLVRLNHTDLWRNGGGYEDDDEDDLLDDMMDFGSRKEANGNDRSDGNWWLRHGMGAGEKIGDIVETAAYKAVCAAVMSVLARSLSAMHGVGVMDIADIRLSLEQTPNLPPLPGSRRHSNYAKEAIENAIRRGAKKNRKRRSYMQRSYTEHDFIQRDAVVETLLSHCQISAPLLSTFPLAWQRALLGNIITLATAVVADFCDGLEFQILGHRLTFSFKPLTEEDILRGMKGEAFSRRRARPEEFEAAVRATAAELREKLNFLDKWHERILGGFIVRVQISNLIARVVLTLIDDILRGARMDLWATQAGGPRLVSGLEYRTTPTYMGEPS